MNGTTTKATPIMLTSHVYWNLDGFQNPDSKTAHNHNLFLPFSGTRVDVDGILIPNGNVVSNLQGSVNDFWSKPKDIGASFNDTEMKGNCGTNCVGYDNCFIVQRSQFGSNYYAPLSDGGPWYEADPVASLRSEWSGIQVNIYSDQDAFQLYSCNFQNGKWNVSLVPARADELPIGTMPLKKTQGFFDDPSRPRVVPKYGCLVMEVQDWIDAINHPEWLRDPKQIIDTKSPPYNLEVVYSFSTKPKNL
jgi:aldose 1-epimerase